MVARELDGIAVKASLAIDFLDAVTVFAHSAEPMRGSNPIEVDEINLTQYDRTSSTSSDSECPTLRPYRRRWTLPSLLAQTLTPRLSRRARSSVLIQRVFGDLSQIG